MNIRKVKNVISGYCNFEGFKFFTLLGVYITCIIKRENSLNVYVQNWGELTVG